MPGPTGKPDSPTLSLSAPSFQVARHTNLVRNFTILLLLTCRIADASLVFACPALLVADLGWNIIEFLPSHIASPQLVSLNLSNNRLCNLQSTLSSLGQLPALRILLLKVCSRYHTDLAGCCACAQKICGSITLRSTSKSCQLRLGPN